MCYLQQMAPFFQWIDRVYLLQIAYRIIVNVLFTADGTNHPMDRVLSTVDSIYCTIDHDVLSTVNSIYRLIDYVIPTVSSRIDHGLF